MTAKIIPFNQVHSDVECSFCKKTKSQVKRMFSNSMGKYICNQCIIKCKTLLINDQENK